MNLNDNATHYSNRRPSPSTRLLTATLTVFNRKQRYLSAQSIDRLVARRAARPASPGPPRWLGTVGSIDRRDAHGWAVWRLEPRRHQAGAPSVVYLHGGSYISEMSALHWYFIGRLVVAGVHCAVPIYPLAPRSTATTTVADAADVLSELLNDVSAALIGDSAGAGLALAASQRLAETSRHQPDRLVLLSPWLDATVSQAEQPAIAARDPLLAIAGLRRAGSLYAGSLPTDDRLPSPLYGPMTGLPPITIMAGTRDLLVTDARRLAHQIGCHGGDVDYREYLDQPHGFALLPTRDGAAARQTIVEALLKTGCRARPLDPNPAPVPN